MINQRRLLLGQAFLLLLAVRCGLAFLSVQRHRSFSFQHLKSLLGKLSQIKVDQPEPSQDDDVMRRNIRQVIWAVERSASLMPGGAKCLAKALTTQVLITRRGCDCEFKIGVATTEHGKMEAHAWIEKDGQVIMGQLPDLERFQCLPSV